MSLELVTCDWFDADALRLPSYRVGRIYANGGRFYIRINEDGSLESPLRAYTSLTTAIDQCQPMAPSLLEWYCKWGYAEAKRLGRVAAMYGTMLHLEIGSYLQLNYYDFDTVQERIAAVLTKENYYPPECAEWETNLKYDMAAWIAFAQEYQIKPLGIEYVLLSDRGFGTLIDLVCRLKMPVKGFHGEVYKSGDRTGQPKETTVSIEKTAIINFKSGRHGFYPSHGIQLCCEKLLWEENFPDLPLDCALNWSPKEWQVTPSWNLKDWTGEISTEEIDAVLNLAQIRYGDKAMDKKFISIQGQAFSTRPIDCVQIKTVAEYAQDKYSSMMGPMEGAGV